MNNLSRHLWKGLNQKRYSVVKILPQNTDNAVIIMRSKDPADSHWCLEYLETGHYFSTIQELTEYYRKRGFKPEDYTPDT